MKNKILGITKIYKKEIEVSEIDMRLQEDIHKNWFDDHESEERVNIRVTGKGNWEGDSIPIKIEDTIRILERLKKSGANYAEIMYHTDHNGYVFNGAFIRKSTEEEITEYLNKKKQVAKIEREMDLLKKQFDEKNRLIEKLESQ